ncbi:hypothetical protein CYMTET_25454 [Cymbomonas tetramitiformis]|uniref:Uncharacterized protein n=1 Tax=Cymbomonas tetramitiformis TaxID=36881 RepID=A0AAE0KZ82_9CHLO|nr:hypothetical protein CYMTET_25454 [Cymbomonas tetramitiformis]
MPLQPQACVGYTRPPRCWLLACLFLLPGLLHNSRAAASGASSRHLADHECGEDDHAVYLGVRTTDTAASMQWFILEFGRDSDGDFSLDAAVDSSSQLALAYENDKDYLHTLCLPAATDYLFLMIGQEAVGWNGGYAVVREDDCHFLGGGEMMGTVPQGEESARFFFTTANETCRSRRDTEAPTAPPTITPTEAPSTMFPTTGMPTTTSPTTLLPTASPITEMPTTNSPTGAPIISSPPPPPPLRP